MSSFIWVMIGLMLTAGILTSISNNGIYVVLQFIFMLGLAVGIPILHIVS